MKKASFAIVFATFFLALLSAVISESGAGLTGIVYGIVCDSLTKDPMPGVEVTINCSQGGTYNLKTLPNGYYSSLVLAGRNYIVDAQMSGYHKARVSNLNVTANNVTEVNIMLIPKAVKGNKIALLACNWKYVCADFGKGSMLFANRSHIKEWETFRLIKLGGDKVALRAFNGKYVCANPYKENLLFSNRPWIKGWETFKLIKLKANKIALQSHQGKYVCADLNKGGRLVANRSCIGPWETFRLIGAD